MTRFAILLAIGCGCGGDPDPDPDARTTDAPTADAAGALALGEPCATPGECLSGECTDLLGQAAELHCTAPCDAGNPDCPEDGVCFVPGGFAGVCVRACTPTGPACPPTLECQLVDVADSGCY